MSDSVRFFDEMSDHGGGPRSVYGRLARWLEQVPSELLESRRRQADLLFRRIGITFAVYGDKDATERLIPFDIVPRLISRDEWGKLEIGLVQRVKALNMFLADLYGPREIVKAGIVPSDLIYQNPYFRPEMVGLKVPHDVYVHIAGIDIVRIDENDFYVLEDNARTPSGVSYMLENREVMMRLFPELFASHRVLPVENYPEFLLNSLRSVAPPTADSDPNVVLLTPGMFNSAYYEHSFLADKLGVELVEGRDLFVENDIVYMRTTEGPKRVDVIYRRLDDDFLDPLAFRPDSALGVPGLMNAYRAGSVTLANAVGTGVADDKATYTYMPEIIRFYLGEDAVLKNVPTHRCREPEALAYVLDHLGELVVKEVNGSGGYGMLVGPHATKDQISTFAAKLKDNPSNFIAQPTLNLSTCPTAGSDGISPRHVDLRPFVLTGADGVRVVPGGLTRVAMSRGSLVVNSSQGGGTKDTWVVDDREGPHVTRQDAEFDGSALSMRRPVRKYTMLSRTADSLFWLSRYMERSDFLARIVEATQRLATLPKAYNESGSEWESALESSGAIDAYHEKYGEIEGETAADFLTFDPDNPSSIRNCLEAARTNARSVRTALTAEMWDAINGAWLELKRFEQPESSPERKGERLGQFLDFVKKTSLNFDGAVIRTMLRDPSFWFSRLGLHVERADNTARILDVKYHVLLPDNEQIGGSLDYFQWTAILRAVSALTAYHWVYRENIKPWLVADLLILRPEMPRSLTSCCDNIVRSLDSLSSAYGRQGASQRLAHKTLAQLENAAIEDIFQSGLHEFVTLFLESNNQLSVAITEQYLI